MGSSSRGGFDNALYKPRCQQPEGQTRRGRQMRTRPAAGAGASVHPEARREKQMRPKLVAASDQGRDGIADGPTSLGRGRGVEMSIESTAFVDYGHGFEPARLATLLTSLQPPDDILETRDL